MSTEPDTSAAPPAAPTASTLDYQRSHIDPRPIGRWLRKLMGASIVTLSLLRMSYSVASEIAPFAYMGRPATLTAFFSNVSPLLFIWFALDALSCVAGLLLLTNARPAIGAVRGSGLLYTAWTFVVIGYGLYGHTRSMANYDSDPAHLTAFATRHLITAVPAMFFFLLTCGPTGAALRVRQ